MSIPGYTLTGTLADDRLSAPYGQGSRLSGLSGNDTLRGNSGDDCLLGGMGDDSLTASIGADSLYGGFGNDRLESLGNQDLFSGGPGNDWIQIQGVYANHSIDGGSGSDTLYVEFGDVSLAIDIAAVPASREHVYQSNGTVAQGIENISIYADDEYHTLFSLTDSQEGRIGFNSGRVASLNINDADGRIHLQLGTLTGNLQDIVLDPAGHQEFSWYDLDGARGIDHQVSITTLKASMQSGAGDDTLVSGSAGDHISAGFGNDFIQSGDGADRIYADGGAVADRLAPSGNDTIHAGGGNDLVLGDPVPHGWRAEPDHMTGGDDVLYGEDGSDTLIGQMGNDYLSGGNGRDWLQGDHDDQRPDHPLLNGNDTLDGGDNFDMLVGNGGDDLLHGGNDGDVLRGDTGSDTLYGDAGRDVLLGGDGIDLLHGNMGNDTLYGNRGYDVLAGDNGNDSLIGGRGRDTLSGGDGDDTLSGGQRGDVLRGDDGDDILRGRSGFDTLLGGAGHDVLYGGKDADLFVLKHTGTVDADTIVDFVSGEDLIQLAASVFTALTPGALSDGSLVEGEQAVEADDFILYTHANGSLYYDADGNGVTAAVLIATLESHTVISAADFLVA